MVILRTIYHKVYREPKMVLLWLHIKEPTLPLLYLDFIWSTAAWNQNSFPSIAQLKNTEEIPLDAFLPVGMLL